MKRHTIVVAVFLLLAFTFALGATAAGAEQKLSKKGEKLMAKFHKAIQEKKTDEAIDWIRQVIVQDPEYAIAYHNLGVLLHQKGQIDEAIASFEKSLQLQPEYVNAQNALRQSLFEAGRASLNEKKFDKSNEYFRELKEMSFPGRENEKILAFTCFYLGSNYYNLKQFPQAKANFELCRTMKWLELENLELLANATYFLGMIEFESKDYPGANSLFKDYLKLYAVAEQKPQTYSIANYFVGSGLFRLLEDDLQKGQIAGTEGRVAEIIPYLKDAIANQFPGEDAHVLLGNSYVYAKNYDKAIETYQQLIAAYPQSQELANYKTFLDQLQKMRQQEQKATKKR